MNTQKTMAEKILSEADAYPKERFLTAIAASQITTHGDFVRHEFSDGSALVRADGIISDIGFSATQCRDPEIIAKCEARGRRTGVPLPVEFFWRDVF